jgi:hypothetical protein
MSETETFYAAVAAKLGGTRAWGELSPQEQHFFIQGLNMILQVCSQ